MKRNCEIDKTKLQPSANWKWWTNINNPTKYTNFVRAEIGKLCSTLHSFFRLRNFALVLLHKFSSNYYTHHYSNISNTIIQNELRIFLTNDSKRFFILPVIASTLSSYWTTIMLIDYILWP